MVNRLYKHMFMILLVTCGTLWWLVKLAVCAVLLSGVGLVLMRHYEQALLMLAVAVMLFEVGYWSLIGWWRD